MLYILQITKVKNIHLSKSDTNLYPIRLIFFNINGNMEIDNL